MSTTVDNSTARDAQDARRRTDLWMHARYRRTRDPRYRQELIERHMPLAHHLARRYRVPRTRSTTSRRWLRSV